MDRTKSTTNYIYINPTDDKVLGFIKRQKKTNCYTYCLAMFGIAYAAAITKVVIDQREELKLIKSTLQSHIKGHLKNEEDL